MALLMLSTFLHLCWISSLLSEFSSVSTSLDFAFEVLDWQDKWLPRRDKEKEKLSSSSKLSSKPLLRRL